MIESIVQAVAIYASKQPEKFCVADSYKELNYREYWECIYGYAERLKEIGIKEKDCVVVMNNQNIETLVAGLAIQLIRAIFVPIEKNATDIRVVEIIETVNSKCYISTKRIDVPCAYENMAEILSYRNDHVSFEKFNYPPKENTAEILFTTGTTGKSKGIELKHNNVVSVAENVIYGVEMKPDNVEIIPNPLSHSHGLRRYYANMLNGSSVIILGSVVFSQQFFQSIEKYNVTAIDLVPAALTTLLKVSDDKLGDYKDQISYIQLGSAPIPESDKDRLCLMLPKTRLYNFYGTTESGCSCIINFNAEREKLKCIGKPTYHASFIFVDEGGNIIDATKENPGFLACAGKMNMAGYYKDEKLSKETIKNGYIQTQDLAYMGEDGFIYLLGRQSDIIETGGNKVSPEEIEEVAGNYLGIKDCACIAVDNAILGKEPKLFVELEKGASFEEKEIYQFLKEHLENYKIPKIIEKIDKIPRTYNGKLQRNKLH